MAQDQTQERREQDEDERRSPAPHDDRSPAGSRDRGPGVAADQRVRRRDGHAVVPGDQVPRDRAEKAGGDDLVGHDREIDHAIPEGLGHVRTEHKGRHEVEERRPEDGFLGRQDPRRDDGGDGVRRVVEAVEEVEDEREGDDGDEDPDVGGHAKSLPVRGPRSHARMTSRLRPCYIDRPCRERTRLRRFIRSDSGQSEAPPGVGISCGAAPFLAIDAAPSRTEVSGGDSNCREAPAVPMDPETSLDSRVASADRRHRSCRTHPTSRSRPWSTWPPRRSPRAPLAPSEDRPQGRAGRGS